MRREGWLFDIEAEAPIDGPPETAGAIGPVGPDPLDGLDADQRRAAEIVAGPVLLTGVPGSGKTRTLTHRIAHLIRSGVVPAAGALVLVSTGRAADELRARLDVLLPGLGPRVPVFTFHALGHELLREHREAVGLRPTFAIAIGDDLLPAFADELGVDERRAKQLLAIVSRVKRTGLRPIEPKMVAAFATYRRQLDALGLIDVDDVVGLAVRLLEARPELVAGYRARYPHVSIDDLQDLDAQQHRLLAALVPADGNVFAAGDPDQAIHGCRGADVRFMGRFVGDHPETRALALRCNHRSDGTIVAVADQVISHGGATRDPVAVLARREPVTIHEAPTEAAEAELVAALIVEALDGPPSAPIADGRAATAWRRSDVAILYRTGAQAAPIEDALRRADLPFQRRSHASLLGTPGVAELLRALAVDGGDEPIADALRRLKSDVLRGGLDERAAAHALALLRPIAERHPRDRDRFRDEVGLASQIDTFDPRADRVALLTLHAARGLEFPFVVLVGCEDGLCPLTTGAARRPAELAEERRLFHVGLTRAKQRLVLTWSRRRVVQGRAQDRHPSPYLAWIGEDLLQRPERTAPVPAAELQLDLFG